MADKDWYRDLADFEKQVAGHQLEVDRFDS